MAILAQGFWHEQSLFSVFGMESNGKNCGMCKSLSNWFVKLDGMGFLIIGLGWCCTGIDFHTLHMVPGAPLVCSRHGMYPGGKVYLKSNLKKYLLWL